MMVLRKATDEMLIAAQKHALRIKSIQHHTDKTEASNRRRMYRECEETVANILSECKQFVQGQCKERRYMMLLPKQYIRNSL